MFFISYFYHTVSVLALYVLYCIALYSLLHR